MLDATELARRVVQAMDTAQPRVTSAAVASACHVTPQAVHGWRKTGRISKRFLEVIAQLTNRPLEFFLAAEPGHLRSHGMALELAEAEAIARLRKALPDWRRYVLGLAMVDSEEAQRLLLTTMRQAVPDAKVEEAFGEAPHVAGRHALRHVNESAIPVTSGRAEKKKAR